MQILLADAKLMHASATAGAELSTPQFEAQASLLAAEMARMNADELQRLMGCGAAAAEEARLRYARFATASRLPAVMAYNGQAYKHLRADTLDASTLQYAQQRLWITSFLYGLLRPLDAIAPYRMEATVKLDATADRPIGHFWRDLLTEALIAAVQADDGILLHLSTAEYQQLFHWQQVEQQCTVVQPLFYVETAGRLKVQAVWAKTCRGAMTRWLLDNRISSPADLAAFQYEGFTFAPGYGDSAHPYFIRH